MKSRRSGAPSRRRTDLSAPPRRASAPLAFGPAAPSGRRGERAGDQHGQSGGGSGGAPAGAGGKQRRRRRRQQSVKGQPRHVPKSSRSSRRRGFWTARRRQRRPRGRRAERSAGRRPGAHPSPRSPGQGPGAPRRRRRPRWTLGTPPGPFGLLASTPGAGLLRQRRRPRLLRLGPLPHPDTHLRTVSAPCAPAGTGRAARLAASGGVWLEAAGRGGREGGGSFVFWIWGRRWGAGGPFQSPRMVLRLAGGGFFPLPVASVRVGGSSRQAGSPGWPLPLAKEGEPNRVYVCRRGHTCGQMCAAWLAGPRRGGGCGRALCRQLWGQPRELGGQRGRRGRGGASPWAEGARRGARRLPACPPAFPEQRRLTLVRPGRRWRVCCPRVPCPRPPPSLPICCCRWLGGQKRDSRRTAGGQASRSLQGRAADSRAGCPVRRLSRPASPGAGRSAAPLGRRESGVPWRAANPQSPSPQRQEELPREGAGSCPPAWALLSGLPGPPCPPLLAPDGWI